MTEKLNIVQSTTEPDKKNIWLKDNELKKFGAKGWSTIGGSNAGADHEESIAQINTKLSEHTASISENKIAIEKNTSDIKNVNDTVDAQAARLDDVDTTLENALFKNKGYFTTLEKLNEAIPNPTIGSKAYVGTSEPYAIYIVENGAWVDSGYTGGDEIVAKITTDRIENGAVTSEKIATTAFDSTLSVSGKIAPADVVGEKLTELEQQFNIKSEILLDNLVEGYFIDRVGTLIGDSASRSIAYFNIEGITKIRIVVPKTGNAYACVFAFCNTNNATTFTAPTNIVSVSEIVNYTQNIDLSVENPSGKKYIAITFTTANGNPQCYSFKDYVFKEDINEINNELDIIQNTIEPLKFGNEINQYSSVGSTYISESNWKPTSSNTATITIGFYDITNKHNLHVSIPKTGTEYSAAYAYANSTEQTIFNTPEETIIGNYDAKTLIAKNTGNYKYLVLCYNSVGGNPTVLEPSDIEEELQNVKTQISIIKTDIDTIESQSESIISTPIAQASLQSLKYIDSNYRILTSGSASVAFYDITGKHNINVSIPKLGNNYTYVYAYANSTEQINLYAPEEAIQGNSQAKSFIAPNLANYNYLVLCFIASSGNPTVSEPSELQTLGYRVDKMEITDDRIISSMAANKKSDVCDKVRPLKVLFIANSFAVQSTEYLPYLFEKFGYNIIIGVSYLGGGTVAQYDSLKDSNTNTQYVKYDGTEWVYEALSTSNLSVYDPSHTYTTVLGNNHCKYDVNGGTNYVAYRCIQTTTGTFDPSCWVRATKSNTLIDKLNDENWDAVFFIQGSAYAGLYSSYEPYFTFLLNWLPKKIQSLGYRVGWFMPWAWTDEKISTEGGNHDGGTTNAEMYANICSATQSNITSHSSEINFFCPCGTAVENQLNYYTQSQIWADGQHTKLSGFYAATLVLFDKLGNYFIKKGIVDITDSTGLGVSETLLTNAKVSATNAITTPYEMTVISK